jgi:hypothetical protein
MHAIKLNGYCLAESPSWQLEAPFLDKLAIGILEIHLCGMQASHPQWGEVVGSAAALESYPEDRARFELLERISILEAMARQAFLVRDGQDGRQLRIVSRQDVWPEDRDDPSLFRLSKSNGIALHGSWKEACRRACLELVERHLILGSWAGRIQPRVIEDDRPCSPLVALQDFYEIVRISFGCQKVSCFEHCIHASAILLLPRNKPALKSMTPLVIAFGAGDSLAESIEKAEGELLQRLGFLWGEEIPQKEPDFQPNHLYHQEYFLWPEARSKIEVWLAGQHGQYKNGENPDCLAVEFVDISLPAPAQTIFVAKAQASDAIPLVFGRWRQGEFAGLPDELLIHPIA